MAVYRFRKEELEGHLNKNALWAIVYGDMMSYLMILFLLMLSFQLSKKTRDENPIENTLIQVQNIFGGKPDPALAERAKEHKLSYLHDYEWNVAHSIRSKA
ncbi:MAG: flagellar motor protein MotB [Elusimicrobiota bacterium]